MADFSNIFHAYDIRGVYPTEINEKIAKRIGGAYAKFLKPKVVAVGRDVRLSSPKLHKAVIDGLTDMGVKVIDVGAVPTDMLYFSVAYYHYDGGIQVTASHNPAEFNGLKLVRSGAEVIIAETGLDEIKNITLSSDQLMVEISGEVETKNILEDYLDYMAQFVEFDGSRPLKVIANNNFGLSGPVASALLKRLANDHIQLVELNFTPDGSFPKGQPDPLLKTNRQETSDLIIASKADFGVAWDADGDRCFIADEKGNFISGAYLTALFAGLLLQEHPPLPNSGQVGEKILHDIRYIWAVEDEVKAHGGKSLTERIGHGFFKDRMRKEEALFGGELSGHFYFRDFFGLDNGLMPFILFLNIVAKSQITVSNIMKRFTDNYFGSGEINFKIVDKLAITKKVANKYIDGRQDLTDGLTVEYLTWRFNLRPSNNENLLRLNVEARDQNTCTKKTTELSKLIKSA